MSRSGFRTGPGAEVSSRAPEPREPARRAPSAAADAARPAGPASGPLPPNHHLWRNGRRWWIAIVLVAADGSRRRVRRSLGTVDVVAARHKRDALVASLVKARHWRPASEALAEAASSSTADDRGHRVLDGVAA